MGLIIDSSVIIAGERGTLSLEAFLQDAAAETVAIAAITASELLHGCHRATDAGVRSRRSAFVEALLELIPVLPFGLLEARRHAEIWAYLKARGTMIGAHDLIIAATAVAGGHELATLNRREFSQVPGLALSELSPYVSFRPSPGSDLVERRENGVRASLRDLQEPARGTVRHACALLPGAHSAATDVHQPRKDLLRDLESPPDPPHA